MSLPPVDRRGFLAGAGAVITTLAGVQVAQAGGEADLEALARQIPEPPGVREARTASGASAARAPAASAAAGGAVREYWIRAERKRHTIVPRKRDEMMDRRIREKTSFGAYAYRAYSKDFAKPLRGASLPGPVIECDEGDTVVVHFQNRTPAPVTIRPHGLQTTPENDGAFKGRFTTPGGFVKPGKSFTYTWTAAKGSAGVWPYTDQGPLDPLPTYKGLFGAVVIRDPGKPRPDVEHLIFFHTLGPAQTGLPKSYSCINGRAYAGNTPTLRAKVGQRVAQHVLGLDDNFHTYHLHGHRWKDAQGVVVDNTTFGPGDTLSLEFTEDNPGRWFYHCHVFTHLHMGMTGWYLVSD